MRNNNGVVECRMYGDYALFTDPVSKAGGEKLSYPVPTYEAIKNALKSVYWKPTFIWVIDKVRIMNPIRFEAKGQKLKMFAAKQSDLSQFTYLKNVEYQVRAHIEWNLAQPALREDRNMQKHMAIALRCIHRGPRRDPFLGTRECGITVEPCVFGSGKGAYDGCGTHEVGFMYHGITWPGEGDAPCEDDKGDAYINFWNPVMKDGVIEFIRPQACEVRKVIHDVSCKKFMPDVNYNMDEDNLMDVDLEGLNPTTEEA